MVVVGSKMAIFVLKYANIDFFGPCAESIIFLALPLPSPLPWQADLQIVWQFSSARISPLSAPGLGPGLLYSC